MAKKDSNPLFEYVVKPGQQKRQIGVPQWMHAHQQPDPAQTYIPPGQKQQQPPQPQPAGEPQQKTSQQPQRQSRAFVPIDSQQPAQAPPRPKASRTAQQTGQTAPPVQQAHAHAGAQAGAGSVDRANGDAGSKFGWLTTPLVLRIPRGTAAIFAMSGVGLLVAAFLLGQMQQRRATQAVMTEYETQTHTLSQVAQEPVNPNLIPPSVYTRPTSHPQPPAGSGSAATVPPQPHAQSTPPSSPQRGVTGAAGDTGPASQPAPPVAAEYEPRQPGLNYFRLQVMPLSGREEGIAAVEFLRSNGIDAVLIPINNGGSLKLMALQGFARPNSDPAARAYADRIKTLGRLWKAKHDGSMDWSDLFAEKYIPGRT